MSTKSQTISEKIYGTKCQINDFPATYRLKNTNKKSFKLFLYANLGLFLHLPLKTFGDSSLWTF